MAPLILNHSSPGECMQILPWVYLHDQLVRRNYWTESFIRDGVHGGTVIQDDLWWLPQDLTGVEHQCVWSKIRGWQFVRGSLLWKADARCLVGGACKVRLSYIKLIDLITVFTMIRFSQLCALGVKCRGGKDSRAAIDFGTFGVYQQYYRHATNHRQYATAPQGINASCIYAVFFISEVVIFF